jgi:hypothetical protein
MSSLPPLPPKYRKIAARVEEAAAQVVAGEASIRLRITVDENASAAEIKAAQLKAIADWLAVHPEDKGAAVDWWLVRRIVSPKGSPPAEYQPPQARADAPPPPSPTARKPLVDWDAPPIDWRNSPP